jgi:ABC-type transporter Mla subunit MlaD
MIEQDSLSAVLQALAQVCETLSDRNDELSAEWQHAADVIREAHSKTAEI